MDGEPSQNEDEVKSEPQDNPSPAPQRASSVKFQTTEQSSPKEPSESVLIKSESQPETENKEASPPVVQPSVAKVASKTQSSDAPPKTEHDSQGSEGLEGPEGPEGPEDPESPEDPEGSTGSHGSHDSQGSSKGSQDGNKSPEEAASDTRTTSQEQNAATTGSASRPSASAMAVTEYAVAEDGNIHINDKQKAAIRRLMHPEEEEDNANLGFTKQGKPIKANPYYKYALRAKDGAEDTKPTPPPVTEPHASRLTRRSGRDSTHLPTGPSTILEKIKEEFCEWLASLGSRRNMTVSKERLEELFSLGLENNLVVRPPEVRMTQPGCGLPPPGSRVAQAASQQQRQPVAATDRRRRKTEDTVVAYCRSPSLTYYPELREKWRQMGISQRRPTWKSGEYGLAPPPPLRVRYGDWYIPIQKWTPLVAGRRLAPPETDEARQLRVRELANRRLNETLSRSHAMSALREYIHICQLQGSSTFPEATPKLVRDVDEVVAAMALEARVSRGVLPDRRNSLPMAGLMVQVMEKGQPRGWTIPRGSRRRTDTPERGPLIPKLPPKYKPVKTAPGNAARSKRKMTSTGK